MFYPGITMPMMTSYGFNNNNNYQSYIRPFGSLPIVNNYTENSDNMCVNFETAQKYFENARKKASSFKRDCFSLYVIEHQNDNTQNETYRHIAIAYNSIDLKQIANQDDCGLYFIAPEIICADGSRYTQDNKKILDKINYIPQDGFVYHSSAGVLFDITDFEPQQTTFPVNPSLGAYGEFTPVFEERLENGDNVDDLSLSFFSQDSEDTKTLEDLSILFEEEDKRDWVKMSMNRNALIEIRNNTIDAYQTVRLNEYFKKGF